MEENFIELFKIFGQAGMLVYACMYLQKRLDAKEAQQAAEAEKRDGESIKREERLALVIDKRDAAIEKRDVFIQTTMVTHLDKASDAMNNMAHALEGLQCRDLRTEDIQRVYNERRHASGERP
jgi:hypothetical protein